MSDDDNNIDADGSELPSLQRGISVIREFARTLPGKPGVYRMISRRGDVLYVGKAKHLKRRVTSYTQANRLTNRLQRMVSATHSMEVIRTNSEAEALLLESNLIKKLKPRYNVLLRDDKSFPYLHITGDHDFPRLEKYRGAQKEDGDYFGPFASASAVNQTLATLQRAFMLRNCTDHNFATRSRPCLQYHIKRCTAPCVDKVSKEDYAEQVQQARDFLSGKSSQIQQDMAKKMQAASDALEYEAAAAFRDRLRALTAVQTHQDINIPGLGDADVIAAWQQGGQTCVQVFFFRAGSNFGNRAFFPRHQPGEAVEDVLAPFIAQFYERKPVPKTILISHEIEEHDLFVEALSMKAERKVEISTPKRGARKRLIDHAMQNAREALARHGAESATQAKLLDGVAKLFDLAERPERIEVYDNSHISGTKAVGGMIVAGADGFTKTAYRKFNIKSDNIAPGDDYAMMREVLTRRFTRQMKDDPEHTAATWPDLVLIDGGKGQLSAALDVLDELGLRDDVPVAAIAKGPDRNAGRERFFMPGRDEFSLAPNDPVLYYLQRLRDEAHRFAIGSHRTRRSSAISKSALDSVPGIGAKRKKALLHHFGSAKAVEDAGVADLLQVDGISDSVAQKIYDFFHPEG